jgi:hypothetical protein
VTFTVPAAPLGAAEALTYHEATVRQNLSDMVYEPTSINEGLAVDLCGAGILQLHRNRDQLRRRIVAMFAGVPLGSGSQLQCSQGGRFYRSERVRR